MRTLLLASAALLLNSCAQPLSDSQQQQLNAVEAAPASSIVEFDTIYYLGIVCADADAKGPEVALIGRWDSTPCLGSKSSRALKHLIRHGYKVQHITPPSDPAYEEKLAKLMLRTVSMRG